MYLGTEPCSPPCIYSVQRRILLLFCILSLRVSIKVKIMSMSMCWVCRQQIYVCLEPYCCTASTHTFAIKYVWGAVYCLSKAENCVQPEQTIDTLLYPYSVFQFFLFIFFFSICYLFILPSNWYAINKEFWFVCAFRYAHKSFQYLPLALRYQFARAYARKDGFTIQVIIIKSLNIGIL